MDGRSVILVPVPDADELVGDLREKYDSVALLGVPAHITLLFPFLAPGSITKDVLDELGAIFDEVSPISFSLTELGSFPNAIYLRPTPAEPLIALTKNIFSAFPEAPPYEGKFAEIIPHMTVAHLSEEQDSEAIEKEIAKSVSAKLPLNTEAKEAWLMIEDAEGKWSILSKFSFS
jgi:2'-5' RNA ligase